MIDVTANLTLACDGCFVGYPAVISLVVIVALLIGSIYMLIASNYGAREGYLITMVALFAFMIILSLTWLVGAPGTTPGTGPRAREPSWVPFKPDSEVARQDFPRATDSFPSNWDEPGKIYPGEIDSQGEIETARTAITHALANDAAVQELDATEPGAWDFRLPGPALTAAEEETPQATVRFNQVGNTLLMGVTVPATDTHREVTVFAFRDKGLIYLYALYFLVISVAGFALHLWLLTRLERRQKEREAELEGATVTVGSST